MYHIYFSVRHSNYKMPLLFEAFYQSHFNMSTFMINYEELMNAEYLNTYVKNYCTEDLLEYVKEMYKVHRFKCHIHDSFPTDRLMEIMKPFLDLHFISQYSINVHKRCHSIRILHKKLNAFVKFNPRFGKRKVKMVPNLKQPFSPIKQCQYVFMDDYVPFHQLISTSEVSLEEPVDTEEEKGDDEEEQDGEGEGEGEEEEQDEEEHVFESYYFSGVIEGSEEDDDEDDEQDI